MGTVWIDSIYLIKLVFDIKTLSAEMWNLKKFAKNIYNHLMVANTI